MHGEVLIYLHYKNLQCRLKNVGLLRSSVMSIAGISLVTLVYGLASLRSQEETEVKKVKKEEKKNRPDGSWRTGVIADPKAVDHQFPATGGSRLTNVVSRVRNLSLNIEQMFENVHFSSLSNPKQTGWTSWKGRQPTSIS